MPDPTDDPGPQNSPDDMPDNPLAALAEALGGGMAAGGAGDFDSALERLRDAINADGDDEPEPVAVAAAVIHEDGTESRAFATDEDAFPVWNFSDDTPITRVLAQARLEYQLIEMAQPLTTPLTREGRHALIAAGELPGYDEVDAPAPEQVDADTYDPGPAARGPAADADTAADGDDEATNIDIE